MIEGARGDGTLKVLAACAAAFTLLSACASAPVQGGSGPTRPAPRPWKLAFDAKQFERADLDDARGDLAVGRYALRAEHKWSLSERSGWKLSLRHEQSEYEFGLARRLGELSGLKNFDDAAETTLGATYWAAPASGPSWFALVNLSSGVADGGDFSDGVFFKTFIGALWTVNESLNLGLGVVGRTELEDDPSVSVFPLLEWHIDDHNQVGFVQASEPGLGYTRYLRESLDLYVSLQFLQRQYRLDDDDVEDGALVDEEQSLRVGFLFDEGDGLKSEVFLGVGSRELFLDADGDEVGSDEVDVAAVFGFSISLAF